jgi:predicted TIM-barrel fold metal-dependent hydrolase
VVSNVNTPRPATPEGFREANRWMLRCLEEFRGKLWGYCYVNSGWSREALREIDECLDADRDCVAIKLYNEYKLVDPVIRPVIEKSIERGVPILIHSGYSAVNLQEQPNISTAAMIAEVGRWYPEAKLITGHLGGGGDWEWAIRALAGGPPNAGADISGSVVDQGLVEYAVKMIGAERLYFACDVSLTAGVGKFQGAAIPAREREMIGSGNFLKLVGRTHP